MTLPVSSNPISFSQVDVELTFGSTATISMNDTVLRTLFGVASGAISMSSGWGKTYAAAAQMGYFGGGINTSSAKISTVIGINLSTIASLSITGTLAVARYAANGVNSSTKGYFCGGYTGTDGFWSYTTYSTGHSRTNTYTYYYSSSEIDGITFSSNTTINPSAVMAVSLQAGAGVSSSTTGYIGGGLHDSSQYTNEIVGLTFSTEAATNPTATLAVSRGYVGSVYSSTKGYWGGGVSSSEIDGILFSNETAVNPTATLAVARYGLAGVSSSTTGYWGGGFVSAVSAEIDGLTFSTETATNPAAVLYTARRSISSVNNSTKGFWWGGQTTNLYTSGSTVLDGILFSNETATGYLSSLGSGTSYPAGVHS